MHFKKRDMKDTRNHMLYHTLTSIWYNFNISYGFIFLLTTVSEYSQNKQTKIHCYRKIHGFSDIFSFSVDIGSYKHVFIRRAMGIKIEEDIPITRATWGTAILEFTALSDVPKALQVLPVTPAGSAKLNTGCSTAPGSLQGEKFPTQLSPSFMFCY